MKVLVTGHRGRIGVVIVEQLVTAGHTVVGFDRADGDDILDGNAVRGAIAGCDAVIHLASLLGGPKDDPDEIMRVGLQGAWHVLAGAEAARVQRVVYFSSVNALGVFMGLQPPRYLPIDDDHPPIPVSPYGVAKRLGEEMCRHFTEKTGIATICLRPPWVAPVEAYTWMRARLDKGGDAEWKPTWEYGAFCDVRDVAAAAALALTCPDPGHVTLLLCADDIASDTPSRQMAAKVHPDVPWRGGPAYEAEPFKALVDNARAKAVLGWRPLYGWGPHRRI